MHRSPPALPEYSAVVNCGVDWEGFRSDIRQTIARKTFFRKEKLQTQIAVSIHLPDVGYAFFNYSSSALIVYSAADLSQLKWRMLGLQHTWQSSTYSWCVPAEESTVVSFHSPQPAH